MAKLERSPSTALAHHSSSFCVFCRLQEQTIAVKQRHHLNEKIEETHHQAQQA